MKTNDIKEDYECKHLMNPETCISCKNETDIVHNRKSKCDGCGTELEYNPVDPRPVMEDMMDFIKKQEHWGERHAPSIAWGMLSAVYEVIFTIAPSEKQAIKLITECLEGFMENEKADA